MDQTSITNVLFLLVLFIKFDNLSGFDFSMNRGKKIKLSKIECIGAEQFMKNVYCELKPQNRYSIRFSAIADFLQLQTDLYINLKASIKKSNNEYHPMHNSSGLYCDLNQSIMPTNFASIVFFVISAIDKRLSASCPLRLIGKCGIENLTIDQSYTNRIPLPLDNDNFKIELSAYTPGLKQELMFTGRLFVAITTEAPRKDKKKP